MRLCLTGLLLALAVTSSAEEVRGLWVVRTGLVSREAVDGVLDEAVAGGFNTLFVQVRGRGDAFYRSDVVPRSVLLRGGADFDPLARLLEGARQRHLRIHAWLNVLLAAHFGQPLPAEHVLLRHPEWVMVPKAAARAALTVHGRALLRLVASSRADAEGYYLSPAAPGVAEHLERVAREIVRRYPVDGVHLDFVRYPSPAFDYCRFALESFRKGRGGDLLTAPERAPQAWDEYRRMILTSLVDRLSRAVREERPGVVVSAAVVASEADALNQKFQAWPTWLASGTLDAVCPMAYTPDPRLFRTQIEEVLGKAALGRAVWAGVGAYRLTIEAVVQNIRSARAAGAAGVVLFSHESFDGTSLARLRQEVFTSVPAVAAGDAFRARF